MSRLTKFIESNLKKEDLIKKVDSTTYYCICGRKIRVSDHTPSHRDNEVSIVIPYNTGTSYLVTLKDSAFAIVFNYQELKAMLNTMILTWRVSEKNNDSLRTNISKLKKEYNQAIKEFNVIKEHINPSVKKEDSALYTLDKSNYAKLNRNQKEGVNKIIKNFVHQNSLKHIKKIKL